MQHQALKYAPSLVTDGRFTQGLSHWFGSFVTHGKSLDGFYRAECDARLAGNYSSGMPYGISQYIDFPEMHSFPATRTASLVQLYPLGSNLALLVTTGDTQLEGSPLQPGIEGTPSPQNRFQHPFRWQDDDGSVNIEPTSSISLSLSGYDSYDGEYAAGTVLVQSAPTVTEIVHHRLYVSPRNPLVPDASSLNYGSTRVECVPDEDLTSGTLTFLGTDEGEIERLRDRVNELGVTRIVVVLADERQVMLETVGALTTTTSGQHKFDAQYAELAPGGLAPDQSAVFSEWALFPRTDVTCKYTMPLYGYKYTLAYSYQGRTPQRAELTFRSTVSGEDGLTLPGFGDVTFRVPSTSRESSFQAQKTNNYLRNVEVLRAESRAKVVGRPLLNIPVVDVASPQQQTRTVTRFAKYNSPTVGYVSCERSEVDLEARPVVNMRWEEGDASLSVPGKLWLGGIVVPDSIPVGAQSGDPLGEVSFTGHLAGQNPVDGFLATVQDFVATILYGTPGTLTAELFVGNVGGSSGEELYVNFTYAAPDDQAATPIYVSNYLNPDGDLISAETYSVKPEDTVGIRGSHWGTSTTLQFPRITVGSVVSFSGAVGPLEFLNSNAYEVVSVYLPPAASSRPDLDIGLQGVSSADFDRATTVAVGPGIGTQVGLQDSGPVDQTCFLTDISMWSGDRTAELPRSDTSGLDSRDLLERHTDPLGSMFPKGTVVLYAGGGACPAGFKPVQATAEAAQPGVPDVALASPEATVYDSETNTTKLKFPLGSLPPLLDPSGGPISLTSAATVPVPASSLEFNSQGQRVPAADILGDEIQLSQVIKTFRNAVEVGMTLRVQESAAADGAPLVNEDRGFMVIDDLAIDLPPVYQADSAKRSSRPAGGGAGYRTGQDNEDVGSAAPSDPAYHWGRGFGTVTYVSADQGRMLAYDPNQLGYNRPEDQALLQTSNLQQALRGALDPTGTRANYHLLPKYPTRFTQTPQFAPVAPGIWGQRERFFYDTPASEDPRTDFEQSPAIDNRNSPAILMTCRGFVNEVQIETGAGGGESRIGVPKGGNYGYLPNPAWDLLGLDQLTSEVINKFPAQPIQTSTDLLAGGNSTASQGRVPIWEGMVFFCRIYAKCPEESWDEQLGRPSPNADITGWWSSITQNNATEYGGIGFLLGTMVVQTFQVGSAPALGYEANVNLRPYDFPLGGASNARGNSPHPTRGGATWPSSISVPGYTLLQLTPVSLYGTPNQPQEFGPVDYLDWQTGEVASGEGRSSGPIVAQSEYTYRRPLFDAEGTQTGSELVTAWGSVGPGSDTSTLTVLGDARGLEAGNNLIYVEPSGYLKYGLTGAQMDYGPGRHTHDVARNPNLLGPMNLAQPVDAEGRYRSALPSVHGHGSAGTSRPMIPVANLFTSCIKL